jgi:hypothetical protein
MSEVDRLSAALDELDVRHWAQENPHVGGATIVLDDVGARRLRILVEELADSPTPTLLREQRGELD